MTNKIAAIKILLTVSLVFCLAYLLYLITTIFFVTTIFEPENIRKESKMVLETISNKFGNQVLQNRKTPVQQKATNESDANMKKLNVRQERLKRLVQASMTDPDAIIIPPSQENNWRGVTRGELEARHKRLDAEIQASMTNPDAIIIPPSEANNWRGVTRGELTARQKKLDIDIENSMKSPTIMASPQTENEK